MKMVCIFGLLENKNSVAFYEHLKGKRLHNKKETRGIIEIAYAWGITREK
tara:strand:+ start:370 stop:519 length:150 start_codon:yes stop_codon:yes gene_type:complete